MEITVGISQEEQEKEIPFHTLLKLLLISFIQKVQETADAYYLSKDFNNKKVQHLGAGLGSVHARITAYILQ